MEWTAKKVSGIIFQGPRDPYEKVSGTISARQQSRQVVPDTILPFRSYRKILVSFDHALRSDVNSFQILSGIKPSATMVFKEADMVPQPGKGRTKGTEVIK